FLYWICYWKKSRAKPSTRQKNVSILLILDMLLEAGPKCLKSRLRTVSILLILDMLLEESLEGLFDYVKSLFQSFLYWICYWKETDTGSLAFLPACFQSSYTGYATGSGNGQKRAAQGEVLFQSFLYWICYWKLKTKLIIMLSAS